MQNLRKELTDLFLKLLKIPSPSGEEKEMLEFCKSYLEFYEVKTEIHPKSLPFSNTGNLIGYLRGNKKGWLLLSAHLDTIRKGNPEIKYEIKKDIIKSSGSTILGADDKSGIAIILHLVKEIKEKQLSTPSLQIIFTVSEERGLKGASRINLNKIKSDFGIVLDGEGGSGIIYNGAPTGIKFLIEFYGRSAHAGIRPEEGINTIVMASEFIRCFKWGRLGKKTTNNVGRIVGGEARNIVPDKVEVEGEIRSFYTKKIEDFIKNLNKKAEFIQNKYKGKIKINIEKNYDGYTIPVSNPFLKKIKEIAKLSEISLNFIHSCGGSDANVFNKKCPTIVMATGKRNNHTFREYIKIEDMVNTYILLKKIITLW